MCDCDLVYVSVSSLTERRARKPHRCGDCSRTIEPGERYWYLFGIYDGEPGSAKRCQRCKRLGELIRRLYDVCDPWGSLYETIDECTDHGRLFAELRRRRRRLMGGAAC